ncbi:hypothetical protein BC628DRAFT_629785 [Trametes gibbosa]|nr:hypothetical protein BC628DRAFT_629785 [Trametes gibbosa]
MSEQLSFQTFAKLLVLMMPYHRAEVVLSELLTNFTFELSDRPVVWNLAGISYPSISAESTSVELWLKVGKRLGGGR